MNKVTDQKINTTKTHPKHSLPPLKYDYAALEPHIDARTMMLHHDKHHASYVKKLNDALEKFPEFQQYSALWLLLNLAKIPKKIKAAVQQNAGGHVNHSMFWRVMKPDAASEPKGAIKEAIVRDFGSFADFKTQFEEKGAKLFGSGWVWLTCDPKNANKLELITTEGHDHPLMQNRFPLLLNDVWEHAYYLRYENRRPDYLKAWWSLVDWEMAAQYYALADGSVEAFLKAEEEFLQSEQR